MADTPKADLWKAVKHPRIRPWLTVAASMPAGVVMHSLWGQSGAAGAGLALASVALTATTWWAGDGTTKARRLHATLSTGVGTSYLVVATVTDPFHPVLASTWAIGGMVAAGSWNIRQVLRVNPDTKTGDQTTTETGALVKALGKAKLALKGEPKVEPNKVTAPYRITDPGSLTNAEIGRRIENIAGELGISPNSIRIVADPDDAAQGEFVFIPKDMLTDGAPWPGPSALDGSITEPIVIGIYEDGAPEQLWFPADEKARRNGTHFLVAGMNGSAKSTGMTFAMLEALSRRDVIVWACDPSKGMQTFGPLLPYLDWAEMTTSGGEAMIDALSQVITARADELGRHGFKNWTPEAFDKLHMPYMIVWIEEAAKFFREGTEMEGLVMEARSAGISVIVSLQRPSSTSMPTDVREQLGGVICFGVKGSTTADMALPDDVRDAGARPEAWENRKPGYNYLVAPGVDEERYAMKARTWTPISDDDISAVLARCPHTPAGPTTTRAAGEAYANRTIHMPGQALTSIDSKETIISKEDAARDEEVLLERQNLRDIDEMIGDDEGAPGPDVDPDMEIPPVSQVWKFGQEGEQLQEKTPEQAMSALLALLDEFRQKKLTRVGPKDFQPHGKNGRYGRSRAWLSEKLTDLADEGVHLEETDEPGVYKLLYPSLTPA